jgi:hypothetical protein
VGCYASGRGGQKNWCSGPIAIPVRLSCSRGEAGSHQSPVRSHNFRFSPAAIFAEPPPVVCVFCSKLRAPHRGMSLSMFVCRANKNYTHQLRPPSGLGDPYTLPPFGEYPLLALLVLPRLAAALALAAAAASWSVRAASPAGIYPCLLLIRLLPHPRFLRLVRPLKPLAAKWRGSSPRERLRPRAAPSAPGARSPAARQGAAARLHQKLRRCWLRGAKGPAASASPRRPLPPRPPPRTPARSPAAHQCRRPPRGRPQSREQERAPGLATKQKHTRTHRKRQNKRG